MVFVRTLELSKAIQYWIENHPHLKQLRPGRVTGTRRGLNDGGECPQFGAAVVGRDVGTREPLYEAHN